MNANWKNLVSAQLLCFINNLENISIRVQSWNSNTLATWCKELTHLKRPCCWERLRAGGEGDTTEDEMVGWHHRLDGHGFVWTPGVGDGQGGLACCRSWGCKESDTTEGRNWKQPQETACVCLVMSDCDLMDFVTHQVLFPRNFQGKNTGVGSHFLLQGIFPTQGLNPCLLHWEADSLPFSHVGKD